MSYDMTNSVDEKKRIIAESFARIATSYQSIAYFSLLGQQLVDLPTARVLDVASVRGAILFFKRMSMVVTRKLFVALVVVSGLITLIAMPRGTDSLLSPQLVQANADTTCPEVVKSALQRVDQRCASTGRNSLCYGNIRLEITPQGDAPKFTFAKPGDQAQLKNVQSLQLSSLNSDTNEW